jgi:beta-glucanase (GH16 family)
MIEGETFYNDGLQYYRCENVTIREGFLEIEAKKESFGEHEYTSGFISTKGKFEFRYGKIIFRAKHAYGEGLLSAISLLPADDSSYPLLEIFGAFGKEDKIWSGIHDSEDDSFHQSNRIWNSKKDEFFLYEFNWDENEISLFMDNELVYKTDRNVPNNDMFLVIDLTVGGDWAGKPIDSDLPSKFLLDNIIIIPKGVDETCE